MYDCLEEIIVLDVPGGELKKILVEEFLLLIFFTNLPPINIAAVHQCFCLVLDGCEIKVHADRAVITI